MDNLQQNPHANAIISRAKGIITDPAGEWAKIAMEGDPPKPIFMRYAMPLIAIGPLATFIGGQLFGIGAFGINIRPTLMGGLTTLVVSYVLALAGLWVVAWAANFISPKFGGRDDFPASFRLVAYSMTAAWLAGIFGLMTMLSILTLLGLYSFYLLYKGATPILGVPQDKAIGFVVVTVLLAIVANIVASLIAASVVGAGMLAGGAAGGAVAGSDAVSMDFGDNGAIETGADGTMTITGPDGEKVTINVNTGESE